MLRTTTATPGRTPPEESVTTPSTLPVAAVCARRADARHRSMAATPRTLTNQLGRIRTSRCEPVFDLGSRWNAAILSRPYDGAEIREGRRACPAAFDPNRCGEGGALRRWLIADAGGLRLAKLLRF